jgi:tetratricopeptide (TPR) repeat protein
MNRRRYLLLLVPFLLSAQAVQAGSAESVNAKERRARTACLAGDYTEGVRLLSELFVATMNATFIYNQGRCFEQNRRYEDAIGRFQEYLRAGRKITKAEQADAQKHINDCKELLASERAQAAAVAPAAPPPVAVAPVAPAAVITTPTAPTPQP